MAKISNSTSSDPLVSLALLPPPCLFFLNHMRMFTVNPILHISPLKLLFFSIEQLLVVNEDGTMSRIDNWYEMADIEKANVRRILVKRNNARLERLRAERDQANADEEAAAKGSKDN